MTKEKIETFKLLSGVNVNEKTKKKGNFTYLSWAFAWEVLKENFPDAKVRVYENEDGLPFFASEGIGIMVKVGVTINELEHISYLPVMDFKNKAIKPDVADMMQINKAIQRATVKAISLHGLGLYIYAGEDEPSGSEVEGEEQTEEPKPTLVPLKENDENWETVVNFAKKSKNPETVMDRLKEKYKMTKTVEAKIKKHTER